MAYAGNNSSCPGIIYIYNSFKLKGEKRMSHKMEELKKQIAEVASEELQKAVDFLTQKIHELMVGSLARSLEDENISANVAYHCTGSKFGCGDYRCPSNYNHSCRDIFDCTIKFGVGLTPPQVGPMPMREE